MLLSILSIVYFNDFDIAGYKQEKFDFTNRSSCHKSWAYNGYSLNIFYKLKDVLEEGILTNNNKSNIFFHKTECIHDGVIRLHARYILVYIIIFYQL